MKTLLIIASFLFCITVSTKIQQIQQNLQSNSLIFINKLMKLNNLPSSLQLQNCLIEPKHSVQFLQIIQQFAYNGTIANSGLLPKVLGMTIDKFYKILQQNITSCMRYSNDLKLLMYHQNISQKNAYQQFQEFTKRNFLDVHYIFTNMSEILNNKALNDTQKYQKLAQKTHNLSKLIYLRNQVRVDDPWKLRAQKVQTLTQYFGISVSNGILGVVSNKKPLKLSSSVLAGTYDKIGRGRVDNLVQTFSALNMDINFGDSNYYNYIQEVNMREGSMYHTFGSSSLSCQYTYYTLHNLPNVFYTNFTVVAHQDGELTIRNYQEAPQNLIDLHKYQQDIDTSIGIFNIMSSQAKTQSGKLILTVASSFHFNGPSPQILHEDWNYGLHLQKLKKTLKKGQIFNFVLITSLFSNKHHDDPINEAIRMVIKAKTMSNILSGHIKKWQSLWSSDIIIQGNDTDQKYIRSMLYHCYSFISSYKSYGISPMGLSGLGYNGHVFWDMDLWIYPALLILKPSLAKNLINYRYDRLEAAKQNAFLNGYAGAMYPWESSETGSQETPVWALTGPLQHHISGCVSFAAWNYYLVTQDKQWLIQKGFPILQQIAMFFQSRVQLGQDGLYHINNVVGADQWAENVNDDAFTNGVAKISLQIANKAAKILNLPINPRWDELSQKIPILKMPDGVTKQHSTYTGSDIKQADANLLSFPLNITTKSQDVLKDLKYYEGKVPKSGTPAMTISIFSLLYSRLKNASEGYNKFKQSFIPYLRQPFGVFTQTNGGTNPYFMTGAGGVLQSIIFGFGGFVIGQQGIYIVNQTLPAEWKKLTIKYQKIIKDVKESNNGGSI